MSGMQPEELAEQQLKDEIIGRVERADWLKLSQMANDNGIDLKDMIGDVLHQALIKVDSLGRRNVKFGRVAEDETHIVMGHNTGKAYKSTVHGVFTSREVSEMFLDSLRLNDQAYNREGVEYWIISLPMNQGQLKWWSVSYVFGHGHQGYSVIEAKGYTPDQPYRLHWFEESLSVYVVADTEEDALKRGRSIIKSQL